MGEGGMTAVVCVCIDIWLWEERGHSLLLLL